MKPLKFILPVFWVAALTAVIATSSQSPDKSEEEPMQAEAEKQSGEKEDMLIAVAPPPFSEGVFPCSQCHFEEDEVDRTPREVAFHDTVNFEHDAENRWCLDCHAAQDRDKLHLADGRLLPFEESYRLCGQCHGPQLNDWKAGDHGRRTGSWSGKKEYLLCAHCHDPHSPSFKPMEPLPPPVRQEKIR